MSSEYDVADECMRDESLDKKELADQNEPFDNNPPKDPDVDQRVAKARAAARPNKLGVAPVSRLLLEYAPPSILATCITALYNIVDTVFIGQYVGEAGVAATTVAMPVMIVLSAFGMWAGVGGNAAAAIRLGENRLNEANHFLSATLTILVVMASMTAALGMVFLDPLLSICGVTPENYQYSHDFVATMLIGFVFMGPGLGLNNFIRTNGAPRVALYTMLIGGIVNIALNVVFVALLGWGVRGSAMATAIGQAASTFLIIAYFLKRRETGMQIYAHLLKPTRTIVKTVFALGAASFSLQMAMAVISTVLNYQITVYGPLDPLGTNAGMAAIGTMNKIVSLFIMPVVGVSVALQPILGFNYGAHNFLRLKRAWLMAWGFATAMMLCFWLIVQINPEPLVRLFGLEDYLVEFSVHALHSYMIFMPIIPIQILGASYFQSTGQPMKATFLSLTRQVTLLLPLLLFLPWFLPKHFDLTPLHSIVYTTPTADALSICLVGAFLFKEFRKLASLQRQEGMASIEDEVNRMYQRAQDAAERKVRYVKS